MMQENINTILVVLSVYQKIKVQKVFAGFPTSGVENNVGFAGTKTNLIRAQKGLAGLLCQWDCTDSNQEVWEANGQCRIFFITRYIFNTSIRTH